MRYVFDPPAGVPQWNGIDDPREIRIEDARGREREFTLDRNGFQLVKAPTAVARLLCRPRRSSASTTPRSSACCATRWVRAAWSIFDHTCATPRGQARREPSRRVHNDHTVNSAPRRVRDHLGDEAASC